MALPHRSTTPVAAALAGVLLLGASGCGGDAVASTEERDPLRSGPQGNVAQFVVECEPSHLAFDDPIVWPNQPGSSHLHQFFGNVDVDANPDYDALIDSRTTCERSSDTASYWAPALLDDGDVVEPVSLAAYYRPGPGVDPATLVPYPAGLMMIAGDHMATEPQPVEVIAWGCSAGSRRETAPPDCRPKPSADDGIDVGAAEPTLRLWITFPDCWDGEHLTTGGASDHVAHSDGGACPTDHPVPIPQLQMAIDYPAIDPASVSLASGGPETAHADFWNVWDQAALENEVARCLNRDLVCSIND